MPFLLLVSRWPLIPKWLKKTLGSTVASQWRETSDLDPLPINTMIGPRVALATVNAVAWNGTSAVLAAGDNVIVFSGSPRHFAIYNGTGAAINIETDAVASLGTWPIPAAGGEQLDWPVNTALHIFVTGTPTLGGTGGGNIYLAAWG